MASSSGQEEPGHQGLEDRDDGLAEHREQPQHEQGAEQARVMASSRADSSEALGDPPPGGAGPGRRRPQPMLDAVEIRS